MREIYISIVTWGFIIWTSLIILYALVEFGRFIGAWLNDNEYFSLWNLDSLDLSGLLTCIYLTGLFIILCFPAAIPIGILIGLLHGLRALIRRHKKLKNRPTVIY